MRDMQKSRSHVLRVLLRLLRLWTHGWAARSNGVGTRTRKERLNGGAADVYMRWNDAQLIQKVGVRLPGRTRQSLLRWPIIVGL